MRKLILMFSILLLSATISFAQARPGENPLKGTYQIEVLNSRENPLIPNNLEELVKKHRKENEVSYYQIADNVRLRILPKSEISKPGFEPVKLHVVHIYTYN